MTVIFACLTAFLISLVITLPIRKIIAPKFGFMDVPTDNRRMHKTAMPLIGGLGIYIAFTVAAIAFGYIETALPYVIGGGIIVVCGILDDRFSVKPIYKLLFQLAAGVVLCVFGVTVQHLCFFGHHLQIGVFSYPLTVIWVMAVTNAFNLIDGLDGLCTGITVIASGGVGLLALTNGTDGVFVCAMLLMCAALGFLPHNIHPAKIFLGDTGSMLLGFIMAAMCIDVVYVEGTHIPTMVAIILIGVPVFDTAFAIIRRIYNKKPIMSGDKNHIHHVLFRRYSLAKAVALIYFASMLCVGIALLSTGGIIFEAAGYALALAAIAFGVIRFGLNREKEPEDDKTEEKKDGGDNTPQ